MRHLLGVLGVLAACVLLAVSAAMNWRFGYQLGKTEFDGFIYGAASAAADCLKALIPFFFFAAVRNKMWSQALAAAVVGIVVTAYSFTSAFGHAALNRQDTAGHRAIEAQTYKDLRANLKRAQDQLSWVPQHRPWQAVQSDIDGLKGQRSWASTNSCADITGRISRDFCQQYHTLTAELASGQQAAALEKRIAEIQGKLGAVNQGSAMSEGDPQAAVLASLTGLDLTTIQTALALFIAVLLEVGSGFGLYVAFSQWRMYERRVPEPPVMVTIGESSTVPAVAPRAKPRLGANDNRSAAKLTAPDKDVERYYKERIDTQEGASLTATALYEDYCAWCEEKNKEPLALPTFGREFGELGVQKAKIAGRVRYIGVALKSGIDPEEERKPVAQEPGSGALRVA